MAVFHGIVVYEILENGNLLNGIYTNSGLKSSNPPFHLDNEIARRPQFSNAPVGGTYDCRYIEHHHGRVTVCELTITKQGEVYEVEWKKGVDVLWAGIGVLAGERHLAVSYTAP